MMKIVVINPGSTSTKIALFDNTTELFEKTIRHSEQELSPFNDIMDQFDFRLRSIIETLEQADCSLQSIDAVIGRGGITKPIPSGVYRVNQKLCDELQNAPLHHASNLGGLIASKLASEASTAEHTVPAFIADPVVVDEMQEVARLTGLPEISRRSIFHALNQKAVARRYANSVGKEYEQMNIIVAHMGGGISIGAHRNGMVIDVNNALDGEGPFSPERAGSVPAGDLVRLCFSGRYTQKQIEKMICGQGGVMAHLKTNDIRGVRQKALDGDSECKLIMDAIAYNTAKSIGAMAATLEGKVDAIIITGGLAYGEMTCDYIRRMVEFIAPVVVMAGEDEMSALAENAVRALTNPESVKEYE